MRCNGPILGRVCAALLVIATAAPGAGCASGSARPTRQADPAAESGPLELASVAFTAHVHDLPTQTAAAPAVPATAYLQARGGKILEAPKIIQVLYGSGSYLPELAGAPPPNMASAYTELVSSSALGWLGEYSTAVPLQRFGRGRFVQSTTISPAAPRNGPVIADASIQAELAAQIQTGVLPPPDDDTVYMVHLPRERTSIDPSGAVSCSDFCGYHGTFRMGGQDVLYAVLPDLAAGSCATVCGSASVFDAQTAVASRLLMETITDPEIGLTTVVGAPLGWFDSDIAPATGKPLGEIGDLCPDPLRRFTGKDGFSYAIAPGFSNQDNACLATRLTDPVVSGADLLWRGPDGSIAIWYVNGGVSVGQAYPGSGSLPGPDWQVHGIADFDGDGNSDLLWRNLDGTVMLWTLARGTRIGEMQRGKPGLDWTISGVGDFDHDGKGDIVWRDSDGTVAIWFAGNGTTVPPNYFTRLGLDWTLEGVGDFDGDGTSDLLWRHDDGTTAIWLMKAGQIAAQTEPGPAGSDRTVQGIGDFDGDGRSDILWRGADGSIAIWFMTGGTIGRQSAADRPSADWSVEGVGDFDHDRRSDLLWRNVDGRVAIWFMDAGRTTGQAALASPGSAWTIQGIGDFD